MKRRNFQTLIHNFWFRKWIVNCDSFSLKCAGNKAVHFDDILEWLPAYHRKLLEFAVNSRLSRRLWFICCLFFFSLSAMEMSANFFVLLNTSDVCHANNCKSVMLRYKSRCNSCKYLRNIREVWRFDFGIFHSCFTIYQVFKNKKLSDFFFRFNFRLVNAIYKIFTY